MAQAAYTLTRKRGSLPRRPAFEGKTVWAANPIIVAMLEESGALLASGDLEHSYPHCWRCHKPVIYRATEQWFISLETSIKREDGSETTYRQLAIEEIDKVVWDPAWGKERITNMIATRPDWCISRQRIWGVPIAVFLCDQCNQPIIDAALNRKIVDLFEREGIEAWHTTPIEALLPENTVCENCKEVRARTARAFAKKPIFSTSGSTPAQAGLPYANPIRNLKSLMRLSKKEMGRRYFTSKAETSIAAGSTHRCSLR